MFFVITFCLLVFVGVQNKGSSPKAPKETARQSVDSKLYDSSSLSDQE